MYRAVLFLLMLVPTLARPPEETNEIHPIGTGALQPTPDYKKLYLWEKKKNLALSSTAKTPSTMLNMPVEEYFVEHSISEPSARMAAKEINLDNLATQSPGCAECTKKEMDYCAGTQVITDHCCCDKKYYEAFPYVPHTCYSGLNSCTVIASDCGEYMRIRECCCDKPLSTKWKAQLAGSGSRLIWAPSILCSAILLVHYRNQIFNN